MKTVYDLIQDLAKFPANTPVEIAIPNGNYNKFIGIASVDEIKLRGSILLRTDMDFSDLED